MGDKQGLYHGNNSLKKAFAEGNGLTHWSMLLKKEFKNQEC